MGIFAGYSQTVFNYRGYKMKFTLDWLKDYLDTTATAVEISETLTRIGLEVESLEETKYPIVAKIVECTNIPDTHLHRLMVDDGSGILRQVVCGAPNVRVGLISALAVPGCKVGDVEIKSGKIRGVLSDGMMCSEKELGLGNNHDGIIELDESKEEIGKPVSVIDLDSTRSVLFDAGITPNRPDYLSVYGIARDLDAAGLGNLKTSEIKSRVELFENSNGRKVIVENKSACPIYRFCEISGIKMASSNAIMSSRLSGIGINPKNAPVDATNYICYDIGQPMHCFDADEINGDIIVRNANSGEKFTDLFGTVHELILDDLVISDETGILALAGIIGGARGMTKDTTKNIILESAYFEPVGVRKTRTRLGLNTDSSYRFERGIDWAISGVALTRAANIIMTQCGGEIVANGAQISEQSDKIVAINYDSNLFKKKTGIDLDNDTQYKILEKLGFDVIGAPVLIAPSWRPDIEIPENIVSEIIRIYGYDSIAVKDKKSILINSDSISESNDKIDELKTTLSARGLFENVSYGFADSSVEQLLSDKPNIIIANPIVETMNTVRNSLIPNLLALVINNERRGLSNMGIFEMGTVFDGDQPGEQHEQLIIIRAGLSSAKAWAKHGENVDIYDVRADLLALFPNGKVITSENDKCKWAHPYRFGQIQVDGAVVAQFGELHPSIAKKLKIKTNLVLGIVDKAGNIQDFNVEKFGPKIRNPKNEFSDLLPITRDFAFITNADVSPMDMISVAIDSDNQIVDTNVFDIFDMGNGKKSVAFEVLIIPNKNLNSDELLEIQDKVIAAVESKFDAKIRNG